MNNSFDESEENGHFLTYDSLSIRRSRLLRFQQQLDKFFVLCSSSRKSIFDWIQHRPENLKPEVGIEPKVVDVQLTIEALVKISC